MTTSTSFAIASVSKTFTAALVLALAHDGTIDLDEPVRTYLPELKVNARITVRQLLDHTSGLRDYFFHPAIDKKLLTDRGRVWDTADAMKHVGKAYFKPGTGWHYSNTNYLVLGMLAERVGGAPLADQVRARFLEPLGLRHTWYQPTEEASADGAHGYRFASAREGRAAPSTCPTAAAFMPFTSVVTAAAGAGGFASNSTDLVRWARALYAGAVLSQESVDAMVGDISRTEPYKPRVPYGLGVQRLDIDGSPSLGHSGRLLGFRSVVRWLPDEDVAIAVVTNQSRTDPGHLRAGPAQDRPGRGGLRELHQPALTRCSRRAGDGTIAPPPRVRTAVDLRHRRAHVARTFRGKHDPGRRLYGRGDGPRHAHACRASARHPRGDRRAGTPRRPLATARRLGGAGRGRPDDRHRRRPRGRHERRIGHPGPRQLARPPDRGRPVRHRGRAADASGLSTRIVPSPDRTASSCCCANRAWAASTAARSGRSARKPS